MTPTERELNEMIAEVDVDGENRHHLWNRTSTRRRLAAEVFKC